jgi:ferredoxin-NADP reductase/MOSC domain-containing protein YiiM
MVRRLDVDGDRQGDLTGHGGEQRAVLVYQIASYRYWEQQFGRSGFTFGQFGENFTVEGLPDDAVFIGDRYRIGGALFEVTQPRVTCYRVGLRMNEPRMAALLVSSGRPGFYLRVLEEGEVGAGDEIVKVSDGPERMTVAQVSALLYLPGHARSDLERALRIPALSPGWKGSFQTMLDREVSSGGTPDGNPGLVPELGPPPAWPGFRPLAVARIARESRSVVSFELEPSDGRPLAVALPGQFVALRLRIDPVAPPVLRSYSLSGPASAARYRISVKQEPHGVASGFLLDHVREGDVLDVSAPRGSFTLSEGATPVALVSAGVGATPVLAMLHALAAQRSQRSVWWLFGARDRDEHPFQDESRELLKWLPHGHAHVRYSRPRADDRPGVDYDAPGRLTVAAIEEQGVPPRSRLLRLRATRAPERPDLRPRATRGRARSDPHGALRPWGLQHAGDRARRGTAPTSARRTRWPWPSRVVRTERHRRSMEPVVREPARARGGVRRAGQVVLPDRRLPQL